MTFALPLCLIAACTQFPQLDQAVSAGAQDASYPALVSLDGIVAGAGQTSITPQTTQGLQNRVARLSARAQALRGPIIDAPTRARMARGVSRS